MRILNTIESAARFWFALFVYHVIAGFLLTPIHPGFLGILFLSMLCYTIDIINKIIHSQYNHETRTNRRKLSL